jgi:hypothetical protein
MAQNEQNLFALLAKFDTPEALASAASQAYEAGYRKFDAYSPFPLEELPRAMRLKPSPLPYLVFAGGLAGALGGFAMQTFATVIDYPLNIGGRPLFAWPSYIPITFELTILMGALAGVLGLFFFTRLPQPYHPVFNSPDFIEHGSSDAFYLEIQAIDPQFELDETRRFLEGLSAAQVVEIEA